MKKIFSLLAVLTMSLLILTSCGKTKKNNLILHEIIDRDDLVTFSNNLDKTNSVTSDLVFLKEVEEHKKLIFIWESEDESIINNDGKVFIIEENQEVNVKLTLNLGKQSKTRTFKFTLIGTNNHILTIYNGAEENIYNLEPYQTFELPQAELEGFNFLYYEDIDGKKYYPGTKVSAPLTLSALYDVKRFQVVYIDYDESILDIFTIDYGTQSYWPNANPNNKEGYHFVGWDTDTTSVKDDLIVKALYEINTYEVDFYDGHLLLNNFIINYNETVSQVDEPTKEGFIFVGWKISNTTNYFNFNMKITQNYSLYADFIPESKTVNFIVGGEVVNTLNVEINDKATYYYHILAGYEFEGWYLNEELFDFNTKITDHINLYGKYTEISVSDMLDGQSNTKTSFIGYVSGTYNNSYTYVSDEDGITVHVYKPTRPSGLTVGDKVVVEGTLYDNDGTPEIRSGKITILSKGHNVPQNITNTNNMLYFYYEDYGRKFDFAEFEVDDVGSSSIFVSKYIDYYGRRLSAQIFIEPATIANMDYLRSLKYRVSLSNAYLFDAGGYLRDTKFIIYNINDIVQLPFNDSENINEVFIELQKTIPNVVYQGNINFPTEMFGTTIEWTSEDQTIISNTGVVSYNLEEFEQTVKVNYNIITETEDYSHYFYITVINNNRINIGEIVFGNVGLTSSLSNVYFKDSNGYDWQIHSGRLQNNNLLIRGEDGSIYVDLPNGFVGFSFEFIIPNKTIKKFYVQVDVNYQNKELIGINIDHNHNVNQVYNFVYEEDSIIDKPVTIMIHIYDSFNPWNSELIIKKINYIAVK